MLTMLAADTLRLAYRDHVRVPSAFAGEMLWLPMDELLRGRLRILEDHDL